ncbi:hypothetical protein RFI_13121 [Reticulomyxa filosa]|uniref:Uncharacterized protein n=1 Tax=Reticulomyxa filosa TaxID=46433 RepID=X6NE69_RETFI|nr:hypothetical protein RFI_13121 [Reticulomyxa filosa]|eukprot:ETO24039.1 hypothetical protein RFI_13121 [Reticulomyxa filosa]
MYIMYVMFFFFLVAKYTCNVWCEERWSFNDKATDWGVGKSDTSTGGFESSSFVGSSQGGSSSWSWDGGASSGSSSSSSGGGGTGSSAGSSGGSGSSGSGGKKDEVWDWSGTGASNSTANKKEPDFNWERSAAPEFSGNPLDEVKNIFFQYEPKSPNCRFEVLFCFFSPLRKEKINESIKKKKKSVHF